MTAPTQAQIVQVANVLRGVASEISSTPAAPPSIDAPVDTASFRLLMRDGKAVLASLLAVLIFAPGCAAATVFLMRADDRVALQAAPRLAAPVVAKSDRLPPDHWSPDAIEMLLGPKGEARIDAATVFEDPAILELMPTSMSMSMSMSMRGSITVVSDNAQAVTDVHTIADAMALAPRPKPKREARRVKPATVVAEIAPPPEPAPPPPTFLERLFGPQAN